MYVKTELVSISQVHQQLVLARFDRSQAARRLGISRSHINDIIRNKLIGIPSKKEYKSIYS